MIRLVPGHGAAAQIAYLRYGTTQILIAGGGATPVSACSLALNAEAIMIQPDTSIHFRITDNADTVPATASDPIVRAGETAVFGVSSPQAKISVIKRAGEADGAVYITNLE